MWLASRRNAFALTWVFLLLFSQAPVARAQETIPSAVRDYAQPDETVQTIPPIRYRGHTYRVYYFVRGSLDDPYGRSLFRNGRGYLEEQGIQALLVTRDDRVVTEEETIRKVFLLARTAYMLHRTDLPDEVAPVPDGMVEQVEGLRRNPLFALAFLEQNVRARFHSRKEEYTAPLHGMLDTKEGATSQGLGFVGGVITFFEESGNIEDAFGNTLKAAEYSSDLRLQALAARGNKVFKNWKKLTSKDRIYLDTGDIRIEFFNGLEVLGLGARMILLSDLEKDRAAWLAEYVEYFGGSGAGLDDAQLWANALVQDEVRNDWIARGELARDFVRDKAADLLYAKTAPEIGQLFFETAYKKFGVGNVTFLAARSVAIGTLAYSIANLLYGMDDIYNNFTTADRAAELWECFRIGRKEIQDKDFSEDPGEYDGDLAEAYRVAYLLEALSGIQVLRSYADGIDASRAIKVLANLVSGDEWTEGIQSLRNMADGYEVDAEFRLGHPDLIDRAVELTLTRIATKSPGWHNATMIRSPSPLVLHPNESGEIVFEVQNTGKVSWLPPQDFALMNTNGVNLGALPIQPLINEIPVGRVARWVIPVTAPPTNGLKLTEWQMAYREGPFGERMFCLVIVVPEGEFDIDPGALLAQWLDKLTQRLQEELDRIRKDLTNRLKGWLQRELERVVSNLLKTLSEQCGGATVMAPAALLVGISVATRTRRKRRRDRD